MTRKTWTRGNGAVRKKAGRWYMRYCWDGKRYEEGTNAQSKSEANTILREKLKNLEKGQTTVAANKIRLSDLYEILKKNYRINKRHLEDLPKRWNHLQPAFGQDFIKTITSQRMQTYIENRLNQHAAPATVQREIACLRRMFRLGFEMGLVPFLPHFPSITVDNVREGFFEWKEFVRIRAELPDYLKPLATLAYWGGFRAGELKKLQWCHVDLNSGAVKLPAWMTKTKFPRTVFLPDEALSTLRDWHQKTIDFMKKTHRTIQYVFHREGNPIKDFRGAWKTACKRAGYPNRLFHDFRRTSIRNNVRLGIDPKVCMAISGHRTRAVFDRYNIVSEEVLQNAAKRLSKGRNGEEMGKMVNLSERKVEG